MPWFTYIKKKKKRKLNVVILYSKTYFTSFICLKYFPPNKYFVCIYSIFLLANTKCYIKQNNQALMTVGVKFHQWQGKS